MKTSWLYQLTKYLNTVILTVLVLLQFHWTPTVIGETVQGNGAFESTFGIIILGNAGSGKSFICNTILANESFEADFRPQAVTTMTESQTLKVGEYQWIVYNIPGLVEIDQESIERNKQEIIKAFEQSPKSIVMFVWTQIGGRAQHDDVIAFNALNDAYRFPPESLFFVVNNLPPERPAKYEGCFLAALSNALKNVPVSANNTIFIDTIPPNDQEKRTRARLKLIKAINSRRASMQEKHQDIILDADKLIALRNELKRAQEQYEEDKLQFSKNVTRLQEEYERKISQQNTDFQQKITKMQQKITTMQQKIDRQEEALYRDDEDEFDIFDLFLFPIQLFDLF